MLTFSENRFQTRAFKIFRNTKSISSSWLLLSGALLFHNYGCSSSGSRASIEGSIANCPAKCITLLQVDAGKMNAIDSAIIGAKGTFRFSIEVKEPTLFSLSTDCMPYPVPLLIEPDERVTLVAENNLWNYTVTGSRGSVLLREFALRHYRTIAKIDSLAALFKSNIHSESFDSLGRALMLNFGKTLNENREYATRFVKANRYSLASMVALFAQYPNGQPVLDPLKNTELFEITLASLGHVYPNNLHVKAFGTKLNDLRHQQALFELRRQITGIGEKVNLKTIPFINPDDIQRVARARYVLLDFWGKWCETCLARQNELIDIFNQYSPKGLEVVQFIMDKSIDSAVADSLPWPLAWDEELWNSDYVKNLNVQALPANLLIDRNGVVTERNLTPKELRVLLEKLLGPL